MGFFDSKPKISRHYDSRIYTTNEIHNVKSIRNLGLVKVSAPIQGADYLYQDEDLKDELLKLAIENGANSIINFRIETGNTAGGSGWFLSYIIAYGDAVFIEYND
ncbi:TPA: hypothetical protein ACS7Z7_003383 [Providencia alcalifaciens]